MTKNSRAEKMREKSKNASSAWLEFSQKKNNLDQYHFFFEGYDRFYYLNKFKEIYYRLMNDYPSYNQYECGGKKEVLKVHKKFVKRNQFFQKSNCYF